MKRKSDYAIVLSCNPGYGFGMISTMNAQNYFKTDADWEVAYEIYTPEEREKISNAFPFNVNWTPIDELMESVVDKRTDQGSSLNRYWLAYWLLAHKLLKEKKYKAICVIQADQFIFVNLDEYFKLAENGYIISTEYNCVGLKVDKLTFGDDKGIWDRGMCSIFDGANFFGQEYTDLPGKIIEYQAEDPFKGEANHSVIALNRAVSKYGIRGKVIGLDGATWMCDAEWGRTKYILHEDGDRVFTDKGFQTKGWHARWWQAGRAEGEWKSIRDEAVNGYHNPEVIAIWDTAEHNYNLVKSFMERFNNMIPEIKSEEYVKGILERPRFDWEAK